MNHTTQKQTLQIEGPVPGPAAAKACERILRALPEWFGIESADVEFFQAAASLPTWVVGSCARPAGFLTIKQHYPESAELYVMGVAPEYQRSGAGQALVRAAEDWLAARQVSYLQVKTLGASHPDPYYARTRAFYQALGFCPVEEFSQIWDAENPCLLLIKKLT